MTVTATSTFVATGFSRVMKQIKIKNLHVFDVALFYKVPGIAEILVIAVDHGPVPYGTQ